MNQTPKFAVIKGGFLALFAFASMTLLLLLSLVSTPARSAEQPSLLYATAEAGTELVALSLEANRGRVIGDVGFPYSLPLAFCPRGARPHTITFKTPG